MKRRVLITDRPSEGEHHYTVRIDGCLQIDGGLATTDALQFLFDELLAWLQADIDWTVEVKEREH